MSIIKKLFERKSFRQIIEKLSDENVIISHKDGFILTRDGFTEDNALKMISLAKRLLSKFIDMDEFNGRIIVSDGDLIAGYDYDLIFVTFNHDEKEGKLMLSRIMDKVGESLG